MHPKALLEACAELLHEVLKFVFHKELRPVIDRVYPLSDIGAAHERLEKKEQFGKVVVVP